MIHFALRVKALGVGLGAGVRRNATVMKTRLTNFMARVTRFKKAKEGWSRHGKTSSDWPAGHHV